MENKKNEPNNSEYFWVCVKCKLEEHGNCPYAIWDTYLNS